MVVVTLSDGTKPLFEQMLIYLPCYHGLIQNQRMEITLKSLPHFPMHQAAFPFAIASTRRFVHTDVLLDAVPQILIWKSMG